MGILLSVGVPNNRSLLQLGTNKGLVDHFPDFWGFSFNIPFDKSINPRDLFPFAATLVTCVFQLMLLEISIPKYLELVTDSNTWPWSMYSVLRFESHV